MSAHELALLLAVAGGAAAAALALGPVARSLHVPTPLAFLLGGLLLGELWHGSHAAARPDAIAVFGSVALVIVLLQGGFVCGLAAVRRQLAPVLTLGIAGTAATFGLVALAAHAFADLNWTQALLLGAVLSPTDPAAVFAAVSSAGAGGARVVRLLEAEAGFNDPVAIALTLALVGAAGSGEIHASSIVWHTARDLVVGSAVGLVAGLLAARLLGPRRPSVAMAPALAVLAGGFATFGVGALAHGSGFVAVYLYGLVLGDDADLPQAESVRAFGEQLASLAEIAMFVLLGVALAQVPLRGSLLDAAVLTLALVLVIRPALVYPALRLFRRSRREAVFATVGGLKGAVPILLAALPLQAGLNGSQRIFALAGLVVLASLALQGPAVARLAPGVADG
ncbi:MAG TPA: cation:proton antiporter [Gaiellales bacterium]|nr:cation:proton antiporter [Gaiellales bacterium]